MDFMRPPYKSDISSLVEILKAVAAEEHSLAVHADAEAKKLAVLIRRMEKQGYLSLDKTEVQALCQSAYSVLRTSQHLRLILQEKVQRILDDMSIDPSELDYGEYSYTVTSCGQGTVLNSGDFFYGGCAKLEQVFVSGDNTTLKEVRLIYAVEKERTRQYFTVLPGTVEIQLPSIINPGPTPELPNIVRVSGRGTIRLRGLRKGITHTDEGNFNLTLWDGGASIDHSSHFQMIIKPARNLALQHNSGKVSMTGLVKILKNAR